MFSGLSILCSNINIFVQGSLVHSNIYSNTQHHQPYCLICQKAPSICLQVKLSNKRNFPFTKISFFHPSILLLSFYYPSTFLLPSTLFSLTQISS